MNRKERFELLAKGKGPDYPLLFRPILMHFAARNHKKTYAGFASDYRILVDCNLRAMEDFDMDMVGLISDPYRETSAFGARLSFPAEGVPKCHGSIVKSTEDVIQLKNPDVYKSERTLDRIKGAALFQERLGGRVPVIGWVEGPLAEACDLAGVGEMLIRLMTDPDFTNRLLDKCMVTARDFAKAQVNAGCDIIGIGDAICSQIDAVTYETNIRERHRELIDFIHSLGARVKLHICGNISHLLPSLKDLGMDILDLDWPVSMDEAYRIAGPDVILCGNINPILIQDKSEEEVRQLGRNLIEQQKGRKFILSGGCEITVFTPPENLKALSDSRMEKK